MPCMWPFCGRNRRDGETKGAGSVDLPGGFVEATRVGHLR